jgi:AraC family transcriptional regulator
MAPYAARRTLFESDTLCIGHLVRRGPEQCGELEQQDAHVLVFPLRGVFAKHDGPRRHVLGTPSTAVFIAAGSPYRVSFPGGIGEECMTLRFTREQLDARTLAPSALLSPSVMLARSVLWQLVRRGVHDPLEVEQLGVRLLDAFQRAPLPVRRSTRIQRVKEAIAVEPERRWTLAALADLAGASRYHFARSFREEVGTTLHRYLTRARLALAVDRVLDGEDLTTIALDSGFSSHSHFTARFRSVFGTTPREVRKILTAPFPAAA